MDPKGLYVPPVSRWQREKGERTFTLAAPKELLNLTGLIEKKECELPGPLPLLGSWEVTVIHQDLK